MIQTILQYAHTLAQHSYTILYLGVFAVYCFNSAVAIALVFEVRQGPTYWPAFLFVTLAFGGENVPLALLTFARLAGWAGREITYAQLSMFLVVYLFCGFLVISARSRIREENQRWEDEGRFVRYNRRVRLQDLTQAGRD